MGSTLAVKPVRRFHAANAISRTGSGSWNSGAPTTPHAERRFVRRRKLGITRTPNIARPADEKAPGILLKPPVITGLAESLTEGGKSEWRAILARLRRARLISGEDPHVSPKALHYWSINLIISISNTDGLPPKASVASCLFWVSPLFL